MDASTQPPAPPKIVARDARIPWVPLLVAAAFAAVALLPWLAPQPGLRLAFHAAAGVLVLGAALLALVGAARGRRFGIELAAPAKNHYVQGSVQLAIYAYWGWYHRDVYAQMPLVAAQLAFYYAFDGLVAYARGRALRIGYGPLPIVLSTNVFLWFRPEWYALQFLLIATIVLGKEFLRWQRDGKSSHVFNPSAFGLALFAAVLLLTDTTDATFAPQIGDSLHKPPHMYLVIFLLGLVVQYVFSVTLMTLAAVATLALLSWTYTQATGSYHFITSNLPAPIFLGMHLLMTDPATSPRTGLGRVIFGGLYGVATFTVFGLLEHLDTFTVYDKLLPIPLLNLCVRWIDALATRLSSGALGALERALQSKRANLAHMGTWAAIFALMWGSGFIEGEHEGTTYAFWRKALEEGRPGAARGAVDVLRFDGRNGNTAALNELGILYMEGRYVPRDPALAMRYWGRSCRLGDVAASANIASLYLQSSQPEESDTAKLAFEQLEKASEDPSVGAVRGALCGLVGRAYAMGKGRPRDASRARHEFEMGCELGNPDCCAALGRAPRGSSGGLAGSAH